MRQRSRTLPLPRLDAKEEEAMFATGLLAAPWSSAQQVEAMAERVAGRSRMAAWQRVHERLSLLGPTEARGYVRARSIAIVKEETARLVEQEGAAVARRRDKIEALALNTLVEMIVVQVSRRQTIPLRHAA
jgi:hypothetical protein